MFAIIPPPFTKETVCGLRNYLINLVVVSGYFSNMQIYNEDYVLEVVCAMECVHCYNK